MYLAYDDASFDKTNNEGGTGGALRWFVIKFIKNTPFILQVILLVTYGKIFNVVA